jgi:tetratricopeptide (TPR) repeat protein
LAESNELRLRANNLFGSKRYPEAIQEYDKALQSCPNYLDYEVAVLRSNIAECHLKLEDWKAAVTAATSSIESLDRLGLPGVGEEDSVKEPNSNDGATKKSPPCATDIQRIRAKSLMRRARARCELGGWAALQGAEEGQSNAGQLTASS